jgi:hypothetical protein
MRADMAKVIVERPRRGGHVTKGKGRVRDMEDLPRNQGMTRPHRMNWGGKELNENLAPLRRFLHSRVGQSWDAVYSEISANLKATSAVQQHVRDHVNDFVVTNVTVDAHDQLWGTNWGSPFLIGAPGYWRRQELYVDPRDGILKRTPHQAPAQTWQEQREARFAVTHRAIDDAHEVRKHKGIWYMCEVRRMHPGKWVAYEDATTGKQRNTYVADSYWDVLLMKHLRYGESETWRSTYVVSKRQLNHKELKAHGVQND